MRKKAGISYFGVNLKHATRLSFSTDTRLDYSPESAAINMNDTSKTKTGYGCNSKKKQGQDLVREKIHYILNETTKKQEHQEYQQGFPEFILVFI